MTVACMGCRFADWQKTKAGRLHPSGQGRCRWKPSFKLPAALGRHKHDIMRTLNAAPYINRDSNYLDACDTREEEGPA